MQIKVNGELLEIQNGTTLMDFIKSKDLPPESVVIQYNLDIVKKEEWSNIVLQENDDLEVLRFVGGG